MWAVEEATKVDNALILTDSATSPLERKIITLEAVPLETQPTRTIPVAKPGGIRSRFAILHAAKGMTR